MHELYSSILHYLSIYVYLLAADIDAVRQAMTGFSLPVSSTPDWALSVPEDIWKKELLDGLRKRKQ